jgi:RNA polymerase subunit RPABC4/transcription elongation factor Spt4
MNVRNCRKCKRLFNYVMGPMICPACKEELEAKFQEVKKYVQENTRTGIEDVAEACDVSPSQIQQWVREERLIFSEDSPIGIACERCGKIIRGGRYCPECKAAVTGDLRGAMGQMTKGTAPAAPVQSPSGARMRYLDK